MCRAQEHRYERTLAAHGQKFAVLAGSVACTDEGFGSLATFQSTRGARVTNVSIDLCRLARVVLDYHFGRSKSLRTMEFVD